MSRIGVSDLGEVDRLSDEPAYRQIALRLRQLVDNGILIEGDRLPSETELVRHYNVARMTIRQAIEVLRSEDLIVSEQGRGVFVSSRSSLSSKMRTLSLPLDAPSDMTRMPPLDSYESSDSSVRINLKRMASIEQPQPGSVESRLGRAPRVTVELESTHHGQAYEITDYSLDWSGDLSDETAVYLLATEKIKQLLAEVKRVRVEITSRTPTRREITRLSLRSDSAVTVIEHIGMVDAVEVVRARTVRDGRLPVRI